MAKSKRNTGSRSLSPSSSKKKTKPQKKWIEEKKISKNVKKSIAKIILKVQKSDRYGENKETKRPVKLTTNKKLLKKIVTNPKPVKSVKKTVAKPITKGKERPVKLTTSKKLLKKTVTKPKPAKTEKKTPETGKKVELKKTIVKSFPKPVTSVRKTPQSGKNIELRSVFEDKINKLKIQLNTTLQEKSELFDDLEQVRLESRNLRSKLVALGVDVSSLEAGGEIHSSPEDSETRENIRLLEWKLSTIVPDIKALGLRKQLFLHFKGGTGKTCLSVSYGYKLAELGFRVLMIDADPLGHLTEFFKIENLEVKDSLFDVLINGKDITKAITKTKIKNLDVVPSDMSLSAIELPLSSMELPGERLRMALRSVTGSYDFILIDSAPNIGFLSLNAILAVDDLLIPVLADYQSYHGLKTLFEIIASAENDFLFGFDNICVVMNRFNEFQQVCFNAKKALETHYGDYLLKSVIRESSDIANAVSIGKTVFEFNKISKGSEDILKFIFEVLFYIGGKKW
ncbi:MAG: ParA family protein [Candidatus Anammoxibacter sp.]